MTRKIDYKKFVDNSVEFVKNYLIDNNLKSCILGCSGGIDSTVSACILSKACKESGKKLIGRSLPTLTNKSSEIDAAIIVGKAFCDDFKEVEIETMYNSVLNSITSYEEELTPLEKGNIKARLRMIYLYNLASKHKGLVISNSNLTEKLLGFWTLNGDVGDINIGICHLYKTEVYELANYLLSTTEEGSPEYLALQKSISLTPTDGNGVSKSDCEQFGLDNYAQVDDVLRVMYNEEKVVDKDEYTRLLRELPEHGMSKVIQLHEKTEYKRKPSPITPSKEELILEEN